MALINVVALASKTIKGGRNKLRISVAHNGETRYIVTDIILNSNKEFKNGVIVKRADATMLNTKIRKLLQQYQSVLDEIPYISGLTCSELVYRLKTVGENKHRTLKSIYEEYISYCHAQPSSIKAYGYLWNNIARYFGENFLIEHLSLSDILAFDKHLRNKKLKSPTVRSYMIFLSSLITYAKRCGYVQFRVDPFFGYTIPAPSVRQSWLSVEEIRKIRDVETNRKKTQKCRDLFMLSYYLGGINIVDLLDINFNEHPDTLIYIRRKTKECQKANKYVEFDIPEEAKAIIAKYKGSDGRLQASPIDYKTSYHHLFSYYMPELAKAAGIKEVIYYSARKSFSQHAFNLGVSTSVIDYILGHKVDRGGTSLYSYISVTPEMATKAIRLVLDNLK